jgi:hypothetical protein
MRRCVAPAFIFSELFRILGPSARANALAVERLVATGGLGKRRVWPVLRPAGLLGQVAPPRENAPTLRNVGRCGPRPGWLRVVRPAVARRTVGRPRRPHWESTSGSQAIASRASFGREMSKAIVRCVVGERLRFAGVLVSWLPARRQRIARQSDPATSSQIVPAIVRLTALVAACRESCNSSGSDV